MNLSTFKKLKTKANDLKNEQIFLNKDLDNLKNKLYNQEKDYNDALRARTIIQESAYKAQKIIETIFSEIVTKCIQSVFDKEYIYKVEFVTRRNKTECDLYLKLDGNKVDILDGDGGGLADIVSVSNRLAFWKIDNTVRIKNGLKSRRGVLLADEPFKFLHSPVLQEKCSNMLKELSKEFGIQMILVSDQSSINGDKEFVIERGEVIDEI